MFLLVDDTMQYRQQCRFTIYQNLRVYPILSKYLRKTLGPWSYCACVRSDQGPSVFAYGVSQFIEIFKGKHGDLGHTVCVNGLIVVLVFPFMDQSTCIQYRLQCRFSFFSTCTYVVGAQKCRLNETVLLSTQNKC